jgi:hypothetical protein
VDSLEIRHLKGHFFRVWLEVCHQLFEMKLKTDFFPRETSWELTFSRGHVVAEQGDWRTDGQQIKFEPVTVYEEQICLPDEDEEYFFTVYDDYGDGMCNQSWWNLWLNGDRVGRGGGDYGYSATITFMTSSVGGR